MMPDASDFTHQKKPVQFLLDTSNTKAMPLMNRRIFLAMALASSTGLAPRVRAEQWPLALEVAVSSPWMANQVALTSCNLLFLGLPRYAREIPTPSIARREANGSLQPFPGNAWNAWKPGDDGRDAFVYLNSLHVFSDDTVWCVDQGSLNAAAFPYVNETLDRGAQKLIRLDPHSGRVLDVLRFDDTILPAGAQLNDLRFHGSTMYLTDSGLGGLIVHELSNGKTLRRLSGYPQVKASSIEPPAILAHVKGGEVFHPPNSDLIEITADGKWLFWAAPTGPLYRIETRLLRDATHRRATLHARRTRLRNQLLRRLRDGFTGQHVLLRNGDASHHRAFARRQACGAGVASDVDPARWLVHQPRSAAVYPGETARRTAARASQRGRALRHLLDCAARAFRRNIARRSSHGKLDVCRTATRAQSVHPRADLGQQFANPTMRR
ncbi:hypothetical protein [Caballeronia sp. AZ7_KS35]|uniref:hypothetical protein n=1 Tax=Caballeronia sp. AZ7_KS35 TaxID=2921762 RepID=UPI0020284813|nr:hypothetical protein [Caballeronia sp. AZ7_KS35]